jgi:hypothetical protein
MKDMARHALAALVVLAVLEGAPTTAGAQAQPGIDELLARVGERIADFYARAQHVICTEISTVQPIDLGYSNQGFARTVESELRLEADGLEGGGEPRVVREVLKVNGRVPREKDNKNRDGCTDPTPLSNEPLEFLLPAHRSEYQFKSAGLSKDRNRPAFLIDFASVNRRSNLELIEDPGGHDDCFDWSGPLASRGRIWVDAKSYDVLRVERSAGGPVDVRVPLRIQRRHNLETRVVIMRQDETIRYRTVAFIDPDETLLLPESVYAFTVVSGGLQSTRRSQVYSGYKRFVGDSRVVERD